MPQIQLTGRDIHEAHQKAYLELCTALALPIPGKNVPKAKTWEQFNTLERAAYERIATLLNEKLAQPVRWIATSKLGYTTQFTVILATSIIDESDALEQAIDAIYESGLDDTTKDDLRNTLSVRKE